MLAKDSSSSCFVRQSLASSWAVWYDIGMLDIGTPISWFKEKKKTVKAFEDQNALNLTREKSS